MNKKLFTLGTALVLALSLVACSKTATETTVPVTTVHPTAAPAPTESVPAQTENSTVNP